MRPVCLLSSDEKIYANLRVYFISDSYKDSIPIFMLL